MRRRAGTGSFYQRQDGYWIFAHSLYSDDGKRRRKVYSRKTEAEVRKLAEEHAATLEPATTRKERLARSKALGTHTRAETDALKRDAPTRCRYCRTKLYEWNQETDHIVPVGIGSDSADNLQIICWECNAAKKDRLNYKYTGPKPRPFRVAPQQRETYAALMRARERLLTTGKLGKNT